MRIPTHAMAANLRWTRTGTVWADWILTGLPYGLRPMKDKQAVRALHQALFRSLPGESLLLGVSAAVSPADVVGRMLADVDAENCPSWVDECELTLDSLERICPGQRVFWLSVPLGAAAASDPWREPLRAAGADLRDLLGVPRAAIPPAEVARRAEQATRLQETLPAAFGASPATPAQMVWLHQHALTRGLGLDDPVPPADRATPATERWGTARAALGTPWLDEGALTDEPQGAASMNLSRRRVLKVQDAGAPGEPEPSYQCLLTLADVPDGGMSFPGCEFLGRIDETGIDVDWAMRLTVRSSQQVAGRNRRALRQLNEQFRQRSDDASHGTNMLTRVAQDLADYVAILETDQLEVEVQATTVFCVGGPTADDARADAHALAEGFAASGFRLAHPLGYQEDLWWAMTPGVPASPVVREFAQITTSHALAAAVPLAAVRLGDAKGSLLGLNIANGPLLAVDTPCGPTSVVLHDLEGASDRDVSGSIAIAGELGAGKSLLLKKLAGDVIDRLGRVVVADRTAMGEWAQWARESTSAVVIDIADPEVSLDPLRLFGPEIGSRVSQTFLTPLLNVAPTSERGVLLSDVLAPDYLAEHSITGLGSLVRHLAADCAYPGAHELSRLINVFARRDLGRVVFDEDVPVVALDEAAVVVRTHTLLLPSHDELQHGHLFQQLSLEKIFGRAMYALVAAFARQMCFADRRQFGLFVVDEAHSVTISPEGEREIVDFVRDGRKHRAAVALGSHDPEADFGTPTLRGLVPTRILMRHRDKTLAARGLKWLDLDPDDESLVDLVTRRTSPVEADGVLEHRRGECLMRDTSGNVGRAKVLAPFNPARNRAVRSTTSAALPAGEAPVGTVA